MKKNIYLFACLLFLSFSAFSHNFSALIFMNSSPTALDYAGQAAIVNLATTHQFTVASTSNVSDLNASNLSSYGVIIFLNRNGNGLSSAQQTAVENFVQAGKGIVVIHQGLATTTGWSWWDDLTGAYLGTQISSESGKVVIADPAHPATINLPQEWTFTEAWYNLNSNPRGNVHVLATLEESTVTGSTMSYDHVISWCQDYNGGRVFCTSLGSSSTMYNNSQFLEHLLGAIEWGGGAEIGDAGATIESNFNVTILDDSNTDPMAMDVASDGRVFYVQKNGVVNIYKPSTGTTVQAAWVPVFPGGENGMIGMALDGQFPTRPYIYLHYTHQDGNWGNTGPGTQRVSRFQVNGDQVVLASEEILFSYIIERAAEIHSGGCMDFDNEGNLYISTGDNTSYGTGLANPYSPHDERPGNEIYDAQRSSGDTDDMRGKILRITPSASINGGYTIPPGNLFAATDSTLAEIYLMGLRNPFKFTIDTLRNWVIWGDVGPDAVSTNPNRGPIGKDEFNLAKSAGNYGWPYFTGNNSAYINYNFATGTSGSAFDPTGPYNDSPNSTGMKNLPAVQPALMWMDKATTTPEWPEFGGGNATAIGGGLYHYDSTLSSSEKFPAYYDKTLFIMDWTRNWIKEVKLDANGNVLKINPFMPGRSWLRPMDMKFGPDGSMYILEWDLAWGGAANPNSRILKIDYSPSGRSPIAVIDADKSNGPVSLTINFDGSASFDPDGTAISYSWDFGDGSGTSTAVNPSYTYTTAGVYTVVLTVTNAGLKSGTAVLQVTAGNSEPVVTIVKPVNGGFFDWDDFIQFEVQVTDVEDGSTVNGTINCNQLTNQVLVGHDSHGHPSSQYQSCGGSFQAGAAGHVTTEDELFYLFQSNYTDQGATGTGTLTASQIHRLNPKLKQAEHFAGSSGISLAATQDALSVSDVVEIDDGDYIYYEPMNLLNITSITFRASAGGAGGTIEVHKGVPNGATSLVGTATIPSTGSYTSYQSVTLSVVDPGGTDAYYFVFKNPTSPNNLFFLNWIQFDGTGIGSALPVEMTHFEVEAIDGLYVDVKWQTLSEVNSDYFEIERAVNPNMPAEHIATVNAFGNSNQIKDYHYEDHDPHLGYSFYRLVEVDVDGETHYTEWQQVNFSPDLGSWNLRLFPNPSQGTFNLVAVAQGNEFQYKVLDLNGKTLLRKHILTQSGAKIEQQLELGDFTSGIYILQIQNGSRQEVRKLIKE
jgi:glucose/arabinose dehydrogenase